MLFIIQQQIVQKKELSLKIKPLIERILSDNNIFAKKKSHYNFFNRQSISYFPIISKNLKI